MRKACDRIKPGWVRVNFNYFYFIEDEVSDFILQAVEMVASDGWKTCLGSTDSPRKPSPVHHAAGSRSRRNPWPTPLTPAAA